MPPPPYRNPQVRVHQDLELERLLALVAHAHGRLQAAGAERDAVHEAEVVGPGLARLRGEVRRVEAKVELEGVVRRRARLGRAGLGGALAQELPARVAREAVL